MKTVNPEIAYEYWRAFKVQKICKRDSYRPRTFDNPEYAVAVYIDYPQYDLCGWIYVWLGTVGNEPTTYDTKEEAIQFMNWINDWCKTEDNVEDVDWFSVADFEE